jgi:hypothetical protein
MNILRAYPPNIEELRAAFGVIPFTVVFAYGHTIYNPAGKEIPPHRIHHEEVHRDQQLAYPGGVEAWWKEYVANKHFRLAQEAQAYQAQYAYIKSRANTKQLQSFLSQFAADLSSSFYGNVITVNEARELICL